MTWIKALSIVVYLIFAALLAYVSFVRLRQMVAKAKSERIQRLRCLDDFEATATSSPLPDPKNVAKKRAIQSTTNRFDLILRVLIPLGILILVFLLVLPTLNKAPAIYVSVFLAAFTVIFGSAAKPFIENVISGVIISLTQPVRVGDTVSVDDRYGTIERISLTYTVLKIWDWTRYVIPNAILLNKEVRNYTLTDRYRWTYIEFWVAPNADLELVEKLAVQAVKESPNCRDYEPPAFWIMGLEKEGVRCWVAGWTDSPGEAWMLMHESRLNLAKLFREHGIDYHSVRLSMEPKDLAINQ